VSHFECQLKSEGSRSDRNRDVFLSASLKARRTKEFVWRGRMRTYTNVNIAPRGARTPKIRNFSASEASVNSPHVCVCVYICVRCKNLLTEFV
jgi:hypothetical protein